jgi:8-oxo-dGTP pyrophosphatase MutT (NUDIX family)
MKKEMKQLIASSVLKEVNVGKETLRKLLNIRLLRTTVTVLMSAFLVSSAPGSEGGHQLECSGDYRLVQGAKHKGSAHQNVERAGVILLKDYGQDIGGKPNSRYAAIIGQERNDPSKVNFFAGKCDKGERFTTVTASRELREETGGSVKIAPGQLRNQPYIYHGKKQMFFWRDDSLSVRAITEACRIACENPDLPHDQREVVGAFAIPVPELLSVAANIQPKNSDPSYPLITRSGHDVQIDGYYMRMISYNHKTMKTILENMFDVEGQF